MVKRYSTKMDFTHEYTMSDDPNGRYVDYADYAAAIAALRLLFKEMELSGNLGSKDYGWPKAITASRAILDSQSDESVGPFKTPQQMFEDDM